MKTTNTLLMLWVSACLPCSLLVAAPAEETASDISWTAVIKPGGDGISVTGVVHHAKASDVSKWTAGMIANTRIRTIPSESNLVFHYSAPIDQETFSDSWKPVLNSRQFCGFGRHLLVFPLVKNRTFKRFSLTLHYPEDWTLVTSLGSGTNTVTVEDADDLRGLMICAGDYAVEEFILPNKTREAPTRYILALHGKRDFEDAEYFRKMKQMVQAQVSYFGGDHPAPVQAIALHVLGKGIRPSIPGFNRRVSGFDSILALHTPERPWGHFEFFGMLSHEHMHNWFPNVLRADLGPWFMEGLNDYVAYRILYDSKTHTAEQYSGMLSKWYREYEWCLKQKSTPLMPYRRGMIAAWVFDLEIQRATGKTKTLKNLLQHLLDNTPRNEAVSRKEFVAALEALMGIEAEALYVSLIESEESIPLAKYLKDSRYAIMDGKVRIAD